MKVVHAWGCLHPPLAVSEALLSLRVSHSLVTKRKNIDHHLGFKQPVWPLVIPNIAMASRYRCGMSPQILIICDSAAALANINVGILNPTLPYLGLQWALEESIRNPGDWELKDSEMSINEYVNHATEPSFLNDLQTEFYVINPYPLRKEVQQMVIAYMAGLETKSKLLAKLSTSYKLDKVKALVESPKCSELKAAVARVQRGQSLAAVAEETGYETFEILYIAKSAAKTTGQK